MGLLFETFFLPAAFACSLKKSSSWFFDEGKLVHETQKIFIGRVAQKHRSYSAPWKEKKYVYTFDVLQVLKGELDPKQVTLTFSRSKKDTSIDAAYGPDCALSISFEVGKQYLIFLNSFNPKGYRLISDENDPWVKKVRKQINNDR